MKRQDASTGQLVDMPDQPAPPVAGDKLLMHVKVYSPYVVYFNEEAFSISGLNSTGPFDILPHHHNFMTLLQPCELKIQTARGPILIRISRGVMHVKADKVIVFLDV